MAAYLADVSEHKPDIRARAKRYCGTINTSYDGRSGVLAAALLTSLMSGDQVDESLWKRIRGVELEAYSLADDDPTLVTVARSVGD